MKDLIYIHGLGSNKNSRKFKLIKEKFQALYNCKCIEWDLLTDIDAFNNKYKRTKWSSCASNSQRIWFNLELAKKPLECIEYIVVHELTHLLERNHNKRFILLMDKYFSSWRTQKKALNELPLSNLYR